VPDAVVIEGVAKSFGPVQAVRMGLTAGAKRVTSFSLLP
jgi:hypothetical protein